MVGDYHPINRREVVNKYYLPSIDGMLDLVGDSFCLSKLDCTWGSTGLGYTRIM